MIIYISGTITGYADRNKKSFDRAEKDIKKYFNLYHPNIPIKIINPVKLGYRIDKIILKINPKHDIAPWEVYMRRCIEKLSMSDFIFLLPNWGDSQGAVLEKYLAERLKIPYVSAENIKDFSRLLSLEGYNGGNYDYN